VVLFTDSTSNNVTDTIMQALTAHEQGIDFLVVAIGSNNNQYELNAISSAPASKNIMAVSDLTQLSNITDFLTKSVCNGQYICNMCRGNQD